MFDFLTEERSHVQASLITSDHALSGRKGVGCLIQKDLGHVFPTRGDEIWSVSCKCYGQNTGSNLQLTLCSHHTNASRPLTLFITYILSIKLCSVFSAYIISMYRIIPIKRSGHFCKSTVFTIPIGF